MPRPEYVSESLIRDTSGLSTVNKDQIAERGARMARRDDREYREYLREEQRRQPGCPAREVVLDQRGQAPSLIWNDLLSSPRSFDGGLAVAEQASACSAWVHPTTWWARCPGAPKAPPLGREALDAVSITWYSDASVAGPRRRRTLEGASTTSHADIRWLPRLPAAEHA